MLVTNKNVLDGLKGLQQTQKIPLKRSVLIIVFLKGRGMSYLSCLLAAL